MPSMDLIEKNCKFYTQDQDFDSWFKVAEVDYLHLIKNLPWKSLLNRFTGPCRLLDVGCGTGRFPSLLRKAVPIENPIVTDFLDPSPYSLSSLKKKLYPPFHAGHPFQTTLENLPLHPFNIGRYHLVWAIHSLYTLPFEKMSHGIKKLQALLHPNLGTCLIFLAARNSFYISFYEHYLQTFFPKETDRSFLDANRIVSFLKDQGISHRKTPLRFHHTIQGSDSPTLERYLSKCTFDSRSLDFWFQNNPLKEFLLSFYSDGTYRFFQEVWLIQINGKENSVFDFLPPKPFPTF